MPNPEFRFKRFAVRQDRCALKVGTDGVLFGAWTGHEGAGRILDIGAGTGLLALIAAQRNATARIDAVEIDDAAAGQAAENFADSPWAERLRAHRMDVRRMRATEPYDLIVCNPPYYSGYSPSADERAGLAKHGAELTFTELLDAVDRLLAPQGRFAVIVPMDREPGFVRDAELRGLFPRRRCVVRYLAHRPPKRVLLELHRGAGAMEERELTVGNSGPADHTPDYQALIADLLPGK